MACIWVAILPATTTTTPPLHIRVVWCETVPMAKNEVKSCIPIFLHTMQYFHVLILWYNLWKHHGNVYPKRSVYWRHSPVYNCTTSSSRNLKYILQIRFQWIYCLSLWIKSLLCSFPLDIYKTCVSNSGQCYLPLTEEPNSFTSTCAYMTHKPSSM